VQTLTYLSCVHQQGEILDEPPNSQKWSARKLSLAEMDNDDWLDEEDALAVDEKALLEARLAAYAKDPDSGSTWEEVEGRLLACLSRQPNGRTGL
jgi:putative addiction module component (TIGR02574 family)